MNEASPGRHRRAAFVAASSSAAVAFACVFFFAGYRGLLYDSFHYFTLSRIVSTEGLWNLFSRVRMYGYPLFVAAATGFSNPSIEASRVLVAAAQVIVSLAAALYAARVCERVFGAPRFFYGTYAAMALNPIALIHATELLSDSLSAVLLGLALFGSLGRGRTGPRAFLVFLAAGLAVAVRPANLAVLPALAILWLLRSRLYEEGGAGRSLALGAFAVALALSPQLHGNVKAFDEWKPLLVDRLYGEQTRWGMAILKYGTLVVPGVEPTLVYRNPLYREGISTPGEFLRRRPLSYLATLALHGFAMVDQDLPYTYATNPRTAWRWPLALYNYAFLFLACLGLAVLSARERRTPAGLYAAGAALFSLALFAVYLPVAVESRFSLPLYPILTPAAVHAVAWLARRRSGTLLAVAIAGGAFFAVCVQLSLWLSKQAPALSSLAGR